MEENGRSQIFLKMCHAKKCKLCRKRFSMATGTSMVCGGSTPCRLLCRVQEEDLEEGRACGESVISNDGDEDKEGAK